MTSTRFTVQPDAKPTTVKIMIGNGSVDIDFARRTVTINEVVEGSITVDLDSGVTTMENQSSISTGVHASEADGVFTIIPCTGAGGVSNGQGFDLIANVVNGFLGGKSTTMFDGIRDTRDNRNGPFNSRLI